MQLVGRERKRGEVLLRMEVGAGDVEWVRVVSKMQWYHDRFDVNEKGNELASWWATVEVDED